MIFYETLLQKITSPVRTIKGKVELYKGSTLLNTFNASDILKSVKIERTGEEGKMFGFGVIQKATLKVIDKNRELNIDNTHSFKFYLDDGDLFPVYYVDVVNRDENTNELTITAYDKVYYAATYYESELGLEAPYTIQDFAWACGIRLGLVVDFGAVQNPGLSFGEGASFEGTETLREALDDIAEATQTIYYVNHKNQLVFKALDRDGEPVWTIDKANYFSLKSGAAHTLTAIESTNELGNGVYKGTDAGFIQFVRDNAFWEKREDIETLVENAVAAVGGITFNEFTCSWRGNPCVEIGDKIAIVTKDNSVITSYLINDALDYSGSLKQDSKWNSKSNNGETLSNPTTLGESLKQTFAKVDKANKEITLVASRVEAAEGELDRVEDETGKQLEGVNADIESLTEAVNLKLSPEQLQIEVSKILADGVNTVKTGKGFTFDDNGLTVEDINPESHVKIKTTISNNGMTVYADNKEVLTANDEGVKAKDLHATTYLIIGKNSRFEDWKRDYQSRTACFWIGG